MENLVKKIAEGLDTEEEEKQTLAGVDDSLNSFKEARVRLRRMISNSIIKIEVLANGGAWIMSCLLYTSPSPRDAPLSRMPSSA